MKLNFEYPIIPPFSFIKILSTQKALVHLIRFLVNSPLAPGEDRRPWCEQ